MSVALTQPVSFSPRILAETATALREECSRFDSLSDELHADLERLSQELLHKADEVEFARRQVEDRERLLAEERQENTHLSELIEAQHALLEQAIGEIQSLQRHSAEELAESRRQLTATQAQLAEARAQLQESIHQAAEAASRAAITKSGSPPAGDETRARLAKLEHERRDLEEENKLLRTRATALQETVNDQRRELSDQQAEISAELKQLREMLAERDHQFQHLDRDAVTLVSAVHDEPIAEPDPVVSSVMAQFARLQKDVAQRRKKK